MAGFRISIFMLLAMIFHSYKAILKLLICSFNRIIRLSIAINSLCLNLVGVKFWYFDSSALQNSKSFFACALSVINPTFQYSQIVQIRKEKPHQHLECDGGLYAVIPFGYFLTFSHLRHSIINCASSLSPYSYEWIQNNLRKNWSMWSSLSSIMEYERGYH